MAVDCRLQLKLTGVAQVLKESGFWVGVLLNNLGITIRYGTCDADGVVHTLLPFTKKVRVVTGSIDMMKDARCKSITRRTLRG